MLPSLVISTFIRRSTRAPHERNQHGDDSDDDQNDDSEPEDGPVGDPIVPVETQSGPYRARTDDIHGVNVALYQLS